MVSWPSNFMKSLELVRFNLGFHHLFPSKFTESWRFHRFWDHPGAHLCSKFHGNSFRSLWSSAKKQAEINNAPKPFLNQQAETKRNKSTTITTTNKNHKRNHNKHQPKSQPPSYDHSMSDHRRSPRAATVPHAALRHGVPVAGEGFPVFRRGHGHLGGHDLQRLVEVG